MGYGFICTLNSFATSFFWWKENNQAQQAYDTVQICRRQGKHSPGLICFEPPPKGEGEEGLLGNCSRAHPVQHPQGSTGCRTASSGSSESVPHRTEPLSALSASWAGTQLTRSSATVPDVTSGELPGTSHLGVLSSVWPSRITWVWKPEFFSPVDFLFPFLSCFSLV